MPKGDTWQKEDLNHSDIHLDVRCKSDDDLEATGAAPVELHVRRPQLRTTRAATAAASEPPMLADGSDAKPFHTLHAARDAIRAMPSSVRAAGVRVSIHPGQYSPLELGAADSGRQGAPIVWQAARTDALTVISAATEVPGSAFKPWGGRPGVWTADLRALGVTKYGNLTMNDSGTGNLGCTHDRVGLYFQNEPMTLARYPNVDADGTWQYSFIDHGGAGVFGVSPLENVSSRLSNWAKEANPWLHGYWFFSWADGYVPLLAVDPLPSGVVNVSVQVDLSNSRENGGSIKSGARFYGEPKTHTSLDEF
eukprot:SAG31_NODE_4355_length_3319_cov_1.559938_5_plen_308_part_00